MKETGTAIPVTATGGGFYGPKYSDFYTYHSYRSCNQPLPNAGAGSEHLCTETVKRPEAGLIECLKGLAGKGNGLVVWELMIGRDNCRFPWGHPEGQAEPAAPFHGVVYPDGHAWDGREVEALLGDAAFASLKERVFEVEYFDGKFETSRKKSITPRIDFDLGDEPGTGSPDASAGIGKDNFSIRWNGRRGPTPCSATATASSASGSTGRSSSRRPTTSAGQCGGRSSLRRGAGTRSGSITRTATALPATSTGADRGSRKRSCS